MLEIKKRLIQQQLNKQQFSSDKMEIYPPAEDSYLLSEAIKEYLKSIKNKEIRILDTLV